VVWIFSQYFRAEHLLIALSNGGTLGAPAGVLGGAFLSPWLSKPERARRRAAAVAL